MYANHSGEGAPHFGPQPRSYYEQRGPYANSHQQQADLYGPPQEMGGGEYNYDAVNPHGGGCTYQPQFPQRQRHGHGFGEPFGAGATPVPGPYDDNGGLGPVSHDEMRRLSLCSPQERAAMTQTIHITVVNSSDEGVTWTVPCRLGESLKAFRARLVRGADRFVSFLYFNGRRLDMERTLWENGITEGSVLSSGCGSSLLARRLGQAQRHDDYLDASRPASGGLNRSRLHSSLQSARQYSSAPGSRRSHSAGRYGDNRGYAGAGAGPGAGGYDNRGYAGAGVGAGGCDNRAAASSRFYNQQPDAYACPQDYPPSDWTQSALGGVPPGYHQGGGNGNGQFRGGYDARGRSGFGEPWGGAAPLPMNPYPPQDGLQYGGGSPYRHPGNRVAGGQASYRAASPYRVGGGPEMMGDAYDRRVSFDDPVQSTVPSYAHLTAGSPYNRPRPPSGDGYYR